MSLSVWAQSGVDYDPENPADPAVFYTLTMEATPRSGGRVETNRMSVEAGQTVYCYAYAKTGYAFKQWMVGDSLVSKQSSFRYTMPAHNVALVAFFEYVGYNPENPGDPFAGGYKHNVRVYATPSVGGYFNSSSFTLTEGEKTTVYAYPSNGYKFEAWMYGNTVVSTDNPLTIKMGTQDVEYKAVFTYNPENPANPFTNHFDKGTGEVVIDDFTSGSLYSAISKAVSGEENADAVKSITVKGVLNSYDFGFVSRFINCEKVDLSRTTGYTEIPSYSFEDASALKKIYLPTNVERIGRSAFMGCSNLQEIYLYSSVPPVLGDDVFMNIPKDRFVVYVPSSAVQLYNKAAGWQDLIIRPLDSEEKCFTIKFPTESDMSEYVNMVLELVNVQSGQVYKYLVTDRQSYTFYALMKNTIYDISLKNSMGVVLAKLSNVQLGEEDVEVSFDSIRKIIDATICVQTPDGTDVTSNVDVVWYDEQGTYLSQGKVLKGVVEGSALQCNIKIDGDLAMEYVQPSLFECVATESVVAYKLSAIEKIEVSGFVVDKNTKRRISGALVSLSQTMNKRNNKTFSVKTDNSGYFNVVAYNVPTKFVFSAYDYVSESQVINELSVVDGKVEIGNVELTSIVGATINLSHTYTTSVEMGMTPDFQTWYDDYENIAYDVYNVNLSKRIAQVSYRYPQLVLLDDAQIGDSIVITASSKNGKFMPINVGAKIETTNVIDAKFEIKQLGQIKAAYKNTENKSVVAILYDDKGCLIKKYKYSKGELKIDELKDGTYYLVTMGECEKYNSLYNISRYLSIGLMEGIDYIKEEITVESGVVSTVSYDEIPYFDENKFSYIKMGNSSLHSNQSSITVGNYVTLVGSLDVIGDLNELDDFKMIVDIPSAAEFVEGSVMVGDNIISGCIFDANTLTIPLDGYKKGDKIKFCVIPTEAGNYSPNALVSFNANERQTILPIGNTYYSVSAMTINVPSVTASKTVSVSGVVAEPESVVEIYDNYVIIGSVKPLANGDWETECELNEPYNLSMHNIYAKVITNSGVEYESETKSCEYDINAIYVENVTMYYNGYKNVFDFVNPGQKSQSYSYSSNTAFTFTLNFSNNDTTKISNVVLYVKTMKNEWVPLLPQYDKSKGCWVTSAKSSDLNGSYPVNVSVDFDATNTELLIDLDIIYDSKESFANVCSFYNHYADIVRTTDDELVIDSIYKELGMLDGDELLYDSLQYAEYLSGLSLSELEKLQEEESYQIDLASITKRLSHIESIMNPITEHDFLLDNGTRIVSGNCDGISKEDILKRGFTKVATTSGSSMYFLSTDSVYAYVVPEMDIYYEVKISANDRIKYAHTRNGGVMEILKWHNDIQRALDTVRQAYVELEEQLGSLDAILDSDRDELRKKTISDSKKWQRYREIEKQVNKRIADNDYASEQELQQLKKMVDNAIAQQSKINNQLKGVKTQLRLIKLAKGCVKTLLPQLKKMVPWAKYAFIAEDGFKTISAFNELYNSISDKDPCPARPSAPNDLRLMTTAGAAVIGGMLVTKLGVEGVMDIAIASQILSSPLSGGVTLGTAFISSLLKMVAGTVLDAVYERMKNDRINEIKSAIAGVKCDKPDEEDEEDNNDDKPSPKYNKSDGGEHTPKTPDSKPAIDPAGYVYEGVSSNRIEGVMASCYYKETQVDEYGIVQEKAVLWNAEEYAQENPLFTDENGMYQWYVPKGLWQVKFEKEGYETAYSEWLPVPPPQLEVNVAMVQNKQPEVKNVNAYEEGIEIEFDKYMQPASLNEDNIFVVQDGNRIPGVVAMLNEEIAYKGMNDTYASKVRFVFDKPVSGDEITLTVSNRVKNYAGAQMQDNYTQTFDIEKEIKSIVAESAVSMSYGGEYLLTVKAVPAEASAGKTLVVSSLSDMIVSVETDNVVLDNNGEAVIKLIGELPGTGVVDFSIVGYDQEASTVVNVEYENANANVTANPVASIPSGSTVQKGTAVTLSCSTAGADIYYTLDGTCPCDETALLYDGSPIIINENTELRIMSVAEGLYDSDVVVYHYYVSVPEETFEVAIYRKWDDVLICDNSSNMFVAYQWYKNDVPVTGETKQFYSEIGGLNGRYYVMAQVENGNWEKSNIIECSNATKLKVNPTIFKRNEKCVVSVNTDDKSAEICLGIFDVMGRMVKKIDLPNNTATVKLENTGMYVVKVMGTNEVVGPVKIIVVE